MPIFPFLYNIDNASAGGQQAPNLCELPIPLMSPMQELGYFSNPYLRFQLNYSIPIRHYFHIDRMITSLPLHYRYYCLCSETANWKWVPINLHHLNQQQQRFNRFPFRLPHKDSSWSTPPSPSSSRPTFPSAIGMCPSISDWELVGLKNFGLDICDLTKCAFDINPLTNLFKIKLNKIITAHNSLLLCCVFNAPYFFWNRFRDLLQNVNQHNKLLSITHLLQSIF